MTKFKPGDKVIVITDDYTVTVKGSIGIVLRDAYEDHVIVAFKDLNREEHSDGYGEYSVDYKTLKLISRGSHRDNHIAYGAKNKPDTSKVP